MAPSPDKNLAERLRALKGGSGFDAHLDTKPAPVSQGPSREDALADRLRSLRAATESPSRTSPQTTRPSESPRGQPTSVSEDKASPSPLARTTPLNLPNSPHGPPTPSKRREVLLKDEDDETLFQTDDSTLLELLGDEDQLDDIPFDPSAEARHIEGLFAQLRTPSHPKHDDSDDSEGEIMKKAIDKELTNALNTIPSHSPSHPLQPNTQTQDALSLPTPPTSLPTPSDLTLPTVPQTAPLSLPTVPTSRPHKSLKSNTKYTDKDQSSWCVVCLRDATLRCVTCDGDPYCARCWHDVHFKGGGFGDGLVHRAVVFSAGESDGGGRRVALGA